MTSEEFAVWVSDGNQWKVLIISDILEIPPPEVQLAVPLPLDLQLFSKTPQNLEDQEEEGSVCEEEEGKSFKGSSCFCCIGHPAVCPCLLVWTHQSQMSAPGVADALKQSGPRDFRRIGFWFCSEHGTLPSSSDRRRMSSLSQLIQWFVCPRVY